MAENARRRRGWIVVKVVMKTRFRAGGSCCKWFWLARIIRGSNQQDSTSRGDEIWSMFVHWVRFLWG